MKLQPIKKNLTKMSNLIFNIYFRAFHYRPFKNCYISYNTIVIFWKFTLTKLAKLTNIHLNVFSVKVHR